MFFFSTRANLASTAVFCNLSEHALTSLHLQHDSVQRLHVSEKDHQMRLKQEALREFNEKFEVDPYSAKHVVDAYKARLHDIQPPLLGKVVEEEIFSAVRNSLKEYAWEEYTRSVKDE